MSIPRIAAYALQQRLCAESWPTETERERAIFSAMAEKFSEIVLMCADTPRFEWLQIGTMPTDDRLIFAATNDGRVMVYRGSILTRNLAGPTPDHLSFPAAWWAPIPEVIRVWKINDCEWWAAGGEAEDVLDAYTQETGCSREEATGDADGLPELVTPLEMTKLLFTDTDEDGNPQGVPRSWREELDRMLASGVKFPILFASTET